jgi:hypothetical protein
VELEELHVLERQAVPPDDRGPSPVRVCALEVTLYILPKPPLAKTTDLDWNRWHLSGRQFVGDDAGDPALVHDHVEDVELVVELDLVLDALLEQRLQDHVAGAVGGVAGAAYRGLAVARGVAAEPALVDPALGVRLNGRPNFSRS